MNRIAKKLRSGKGASITFGLLVFLVCAVLCTVIIVAASTASGRMANMAESDQRYYSVTSACDLLKDLINGKTVSIVENEDGIYVIPDMSGDQAAMRLSDYTPVGNHYSTKSIVSDAAYRYHTGGGAGTTGSFAISSGLGENGKDPAAATVSETIKSNGDIVLTVTSTSTDVPFAMKMDFAATVLDDEYYRTSETLNDDTGNVSTVQEDTDITTMTWELSSVKIVSAGM